MKTKTFVLLNHLCKMLGFSRHNSMRLLTHYLKIVIIIFVITVFSASVKSYGQYCTPTTSTYSDGITNVTFNTINNSTTGTNAYTNYSGSISTTVLIGSSYSLSVYINTDGSWTNHNFCWIDWNQNNSFADAGEAYDLGTAANQTNGISSLCPLSILIPAGATPGTTRMRVASRYNADPSYCATGMDGEFEDYALILQSPCSAPTSITTSVTPVSSCTSPQSVTFNVSGFSGGNLNGGSWEYQWQNGATVLQSWSATSSYMTSLSSSVTYTVYMRSTACPASVSAGFNASFTLMAIPAQPGAISGPTAPCVGASVNYSVTNVSGVTYTWVFPSGWVQTGGGTTNSVTVTVGANPGTVQVTPSNLCGSGTAQTLSVNPGAGPTVTVSPNPASACGGVGVLLTASGSTTYSWAPATGLSSITGTSVTANPASTTTYTVTETGSGCNNSASVQVRVGPSVSATASVTPASVCPGGAVNLTSSASPSSSGSPTILATEAFEGAFPNTGWAITGNSGSYNFSKVNANDKCGSYPSTNCAFFESYWNNNGNWSAIETPVFSLVGYSSATLNYKMASGSVNTNRIDVSINGGASYATLVASPVITNSTWTTLTASLTPYIGNASVRIRFYGVSSYGSTGLCSNAIFIDDVGVTGVPFACSYTYSWSSAPAGFTSAAQNPTANPIVATTYMVTATEASGCSASATTAQVTMIPAPAQPVISGPVSVCSGTAGVVYSVASVPNATSYTWSVAATGSSITTGQGTTSITITFGSTTGNITCYASNACGVNSTTATYAVTALSAPAAPTVTGATSCGPGSVTLTASGGTSYNWYNVPTGGSSLGTGSTYTTPVISIPTTYYVAANNGSCDGPRTPVVAGVYNGGLDNYTVARTTGITYAAIAGTNPTWKNGTDADNNLSNPISLPFDFPFDGGIQKQVLIGVDGLITFNTATNADGADIAACGTPEPYTWQNSNFSLSGKLGSLQAIAPFYNDLYCNTSLAASISYTTAGSAPNRIFQVQWKNMSNDEWCSEDGCSAIDGDLNFQAWLYETSGNIEFYYGSTQTQTSFFCSEGTCDINDVDDDYTVGLNSSTVSASPTASQLLTQQTANTATFNNTPQNGLTTLPAINSKISFIRITPATPTQIPSSVCAVKDNYPANAASNQCLNQILSWSPGDGNPTNYKVYFGTNPSPPFVANTTHTYYNPGPLSMFTTYYWKIVPENSFGAATNVTTWSFTTGQGDVQPTEILSTVGTLVSHVPNGTNSLGQQVWTNTYDICENQWNGTLTAVGAILSEGSALDWTNPIYFWGFPVVQCTDALPTEFWGNCAGFTQTPIITIGGWFSSMFNGGVLIYDVFTRGCNNNGACTRIIINLNPVNEAPEGINASANPICTGGSTTLTQDNGTLSPGAQYVWYQGGCGSGSAIGFGESITVSPTVTTTYYVRVEGGNACASTTGCQPITVTVNQLPVIPSSATANYTSFCAGAYPTINLSATGGSGTTLNWSTSCGGAVIGTGTSLTITAPAASTTYYASWTTSCGTSACVSVPITVTASGTPTFAQAGPYCSGASVAALPTTSTNGYNGSWSPAINNTATTLYTFTPTAGQCAANTTMTISINPTVSPAFAALGPYCVGASPDGLSGTSTNGISGSWSPASISTAGAGTTTYTFTPTGGQCASTATMPVTVNANVTPSFTALGPYCVGATPGTLSGTSSNGISGTWSPSGISTAGAGTTTYTFTPSGGQCASTASMPVTVSANVTPAFAALGPYCEGATPGTLSGTSTNGISGNWSPATVSTGSAGTTTYTFTPSGGQCASTASMPVTVNANVTPAFAALGPYCVGATPGALSGTSTNGITGSWSPATIGTGSAGTITYTFTPSGGQCATTASMPVTVGANISPSFTALGPYCVGAAPEGLLETSINGITGSWSPATIGTGSAGTTTYTFTPTGGQCASSASMPVTVNVNVTPAFAALGPYCQGATPGTLQGTSTNGVTGSWNPATIGTGSAGTTTYTFTPSGGQCATTTTMDVAVTSNVTAVISGGTSPICDKTSPGTFTVTATGGSGVYVYQWYNAQGAISGATTSTYTQGIMVASNAFYCRVTSSPCGWIYSDTTIIMVIPQVGNPTPIALSAGTDPVCQLTNGTTTTTYTTTATNNYGFVWSLSNPLAGTIDPATGVMTWADGFYGSVDIQVYALGCGVPSPTIIHTVTVSQTPTAEAGVYGTYTGIPVPLGNISSGPGTFSWSPATGLNDPAVAQPLASPGITTTYTLTVNNNGCIATDTVTVTFGGTGHIISGKTLYAGRANAGNPVPNNPTYNPVIYAINYVVVILKNYPANDEVARDTSDASGVYQFTNIMDGTYSLSYDKYTADSMMWGNDINAIDVALMKYFIGSDTLQDPTRCFSSKYKKAANVDNNASINAIDVARIKAKIGAPYDVIRNFPRGNWVAIDKPVTVAGADVNMNLETICYGDYNASSSKYRDSTNLWSGAKSLPAGIIVTSEEVINTNDPSYFEIPLRISSKVNEFSALGLELNYLNSEYKLVSAFMPGPKSKGAVKINPSLEEIIAHDNDLLVTDDHGTIRVVYATTNHFDVAPNDEMLILGFRPLKSLEPGEVDFTLSGTGVIGNQFGEENEDTYLFMPKIFVQGNTDAGFEFSGYPNPFNGEASITYNLPENGMVTLNVYNAIGEVVATLVNENQESGKHSVVFSEKNLATGLYTFKLEFTGLDTSKCLILKMVR